MKASGSEKLKFLWFELKLCHWELLQLISTVEWPERDAKTYQSMVCLNVGFVHIVCMEYKHVIQLYSHFNMLYNKGHITL